MNRFTQLVLSLGRAARQDEKVALVEAYLRETPQRDAAWAICLLIGAVDSTPVRVRFLRKLIEGSTGLPGWLIEECYATVGDLSETVALLAPSSPDASPEPLHRTMADRVQPIWSCPDEERARRIQSAWREFDAAQAYVFNKLIRGGFRGGAQRRVVDRAIARVSGLSPEIVAHRLTGRATPTEEWFARLFAPEDRSRETEDPFPFCLARHLSTGIADLATTLGPPSDWAAEWKWDGVRAQAIRRSGSAWLCSRGGENLADRLPEIMLSLRSLRHDAVLDGEIVPWRYGRAGSLFELRERLGRVSADGQLRLFEPPDEARYIAFDLLEYQGHDCRSLPYRRRREMLENLLAAADGPRLMLSPRLPASSWMKLERLRESARNHGAQGLMLKHMDSVYSAGRVAPDGQHGWLKWKLDPSALDAVLVAALPGIGSHNALDTEYCFALWDTEHDVRRLVDFAKARCGLDPFDAAELDRWITGNTLLRRGSLRQVRPAHVFEIGFDGAQPSNRHRSGFSVRFPRILRWRREKRAEEADTLDALRSLAGNDARTQTDP